MPSDRDAIMTKETLVILISIIYLALTTAGQILARPLHFLKTYPEKRPIQ
jgi:hypothetical protein